MFCDDARRRGAVRIGEVGDRELALFLVAGVAELRQRFLPVPHQVAQRRLDAELVVQAQLRDAVDVAQALGQLEVGVVVQPALEGVDDLAACVRPVPRGPRTARMKGKPNFAL